MAIKITLPDGTKIEGDSGKEVAVAARELRDRPQAALPQQPALLIQPRKIDWNGGDVFTASKNGYDVAKATLDLLVAIKTVGGRGLPADQVQAIVHADTPKGIGGRMVRINGYLRRLGFPDSKELFDNPKDRKTGARVWKPMDKIDAAIEAASKKGFTG